MTTPFRTATPADAERIAALHIASWRVAYRGMLPDWYLDGLSLAERTGVWDGVLREASVSVLLAEDGSALRGFAAFGPTRDPDLDPAVHWTLHNLHVHPERRGGGLGRRLLDATRERGHVAGRDRLTLWVVEANSPARRFYERQGLLPDGTRQEDVVAPGAAFLEVRYAGPILSIRP